MMQSMHYLPIFIAESPKHESKLTSCVSIGKVDDATEGAFSSGFYYHSSLCLAQ